MNGCKILKNADIMMKLYQIALSYNPFVTNKSFFKNSYFSDFSTNLVLFRTEIQQSGTDTCIPNMNDLLELSVTFQMIYEEIL